jgi:hypothetical protein
MYQCYFGDCKRKSRVFRWGYHDAAHLEINIEEKFKLGGEK